MPSGEFMDCAAIAFHHHATLGSVARVPVVAGGAIYLARFARRCACGMPSRLPSSSSAIRVTKSHRFASAAKTSARANAVSTTFDSSYASDDFRHSATNDRALRCTI